MKYLFKNGRIFTGTSPELEESDQCMLINNDLIEFIGPSTDPVITKAQQSDIAVHDAGGGTLAPGFIDGHMHLLAFGSSLHKVSLDACKTLADIRSTIKAAAGDNPSAPRILCKDWMHFMTDSRAMASDLDDLDPRPIFVDAKDLHSTWCNSAALAEMGVEAMEDPAGGEIHRDQNGKATGLMSEAAAVMVVWPHLAKVASMDDNLSAIRDAIKVYNAAGYTGVIELAMDAHEWELLEFLREEEGLSVRIAAHWLVAPSRTSAENIAQVDQAIAMHEKYNLETSPEFRIAGIKVICDGVVDACTAALLEPYSSNGVSCNPLWPADHLSAVAQHASAAGLQCAFHAIGDAAVSLALSALGTASPKGKRHRIEHLELTLPEHSRLLSELGITASVQPVHSDPAIFRAWPTLLGPERCARAFAYREFLDAGVHLAIGTDAPTAPMLPMPNLYIASTRKSAREPEMLGLEAVNPQFALPLLTALGAAAGGAAWSCFAENITGKLEVGMKADFVVLDFDLKEVAGEGREGKEKLLEASVRETWFDGRKVFG